MLVDVVINGVSHDTPYESGETYKRVVRTALDKSGHREKALELFYVRRFDGTIVDSFNEVVDAKVVYVVWRH